MFSVFLEYFKDVSNATQDSLLATVFGGVVLGIGVGVVIRSGAVSTVREMVAILISRKTSLSVGTDYPVF